jgi:hypothetical protein
MANYNKFEYKSYNFLKSKLNMKTSARRLKPDSCQTHQHKADRLPPDLRQTQTPPDLTIGATISLIAFLATSRYRRNLISALPHRTNAAFVQTSVADIGYCLKGVFSYVHTLFFLKYIIYPKFLTYRYLSLLP